MSLESATYINTLNSAFPAEGDNAGNAADHIRLVKGVLQATFPNVTGPVTSTQLGLNSPVPIGAIMAYAGATVPTGYVACVGGTVAASDGSGTISIPDLRDKFILGGGGSHALGSNYSIALGTYSYTTANAGAHQHTGNTAGFALTLNELASHTHQLPINHEAAQPYKIWGGSDNAGLIGNGSGIFYTGTPTLTCQYVGAGNPHVHPIFTDGDHNHVVTVPNAPPYWTLQYIMKY